MKDEAAPQGRPANSSSDSTVTRLGDEPCRCPTCYGWTSRRCAICAGEPDGTPIEHVVRSLNQVDRAVVHRKAA